MKKAGYCALLLMLAGCGGGGSESQPPAVARERAILAVDTDPDITGDGERHTTITPAAAARGRLLVFLPATGLAPRNYLAIQRRAAAQGLHVIGLQYPNQISVLELCLFSEDANCHGKVRHEVITGTDSSELGTVTAANSINNRLQKLLVYLQATDADGGWGQYLTSGGDVDWSRLVVAGHSQGGGHAGYMSKLYAMERVVYFSSPVDWRLGAGEPASWTALPNITPASQQYGFAHLQDSWTQVSAVWSALGLAALSEPELVENLPSLAGQHQLLTDVTVAGSTPHNLPVLDAETPRDSSNEPVFAPVWDHLLGL